MDEGTTTVTDATRSLDTVRPGEQVTVRRILFDLVRDQCSDCGVREGSRLRGRREGGKVVVVDATSGRRVRCDSRHARFIEVVGDDATAAGLESADGPARTA